MGGIRKIGFVNFLGAVGAVSVIAGAQPAGAADQSPTVSASDAPPPSRPVLKWPVNDGDGWIHYPDPVLPKALGKKSIQPTLVKGSRDAAGNCLFSDTQIVPPGGSGFFSEDVAFNPTNCDRLVLTSPLDVAASTALSQLTGEVAPPRLNAAASNSAGPVGSQKSSWVDPIEITITSLAANAAVNYDGQGNDAYSANPYVFRYDGWTGGPPVLWPRDFGHDPFQLTASITNYNRDFAALMIAIGGPLAWAACGFPSSTLATFSHFEVVDVYKNGQVVGQDADTKSGACSNLVHHHEWTRNYKQQ